MSGTTRTRGLLIAGACALAVGCSGTVTGSGSSDPSTGAEKDTFAAALSDPRTDSYYPDVGTDLVDALRYDLTVAWDQESLVLTGEQELRFRATADASDFTLDLSDALTVGQATLDGEPVEVDQAGNDLTVRATLEADEEYVLALDYAGTPEDTPAPTARTDFSSTGFRVSADGAAWTMQEPFGAFTWYAVNDHPSDKAFYEITTVAAEPFRGVANGRITDESTEDGLVSTTFEMAHPAASYLITVAFDEYDRVDSESGSGIPISTYVPAGTADRYPELEVVDEAMDWLEDKLGPYPFDTYGMVVVDSASAMETQTMATMGNTSYATSGPVVVHELAHHWYGNTVSPNDWRDMWMNEGMVMYLQGWWEAEQAGIEVGEQMDRWAEFEGFEREFAGPPADYDADKFASGNVYYSPALMFHELRLRIGEEEFADLIRAWPAERRNVSTDRDDYLTFVEEQTGEELSDFFDAWLLGETTPPRA